MTDTSFSFRAGELLEIILERMESLEVLEDLDMDLIDGVLTVEFPDEAQMIINRQSSTQQIWLASPKGPAHFSFDETMSEWIDDKTGVGLRDTLNEVLSVKVKASIVLDAF
ncbi:MAG: iron donor protein CyaY [Gammaproteobacteria bacterium]